MRLILIFLVFAVVTIGALFGAINAVSVPLDLYFVAIDAPLGAALLCAACVGWLLGGLVAWFGLASQRRQLRLARCGSQVQTSPSSRGHDEA
jgi:uncharacterized integral membrane protein